MVYKKGETGNPGGIPRKPESIARRQLTQNVREYCRTKSQAAVEALVEVMTSKSAPPAARVAAANSILDRGWGKAQVEINATVTSYDTMSERELIAYIAGRAIEGEIVQTIIDVENEERELLESAHEGEA